MNQDIRLAALIIRDGRLWCLRERPGAPWSLPGGPLPGGNDDIDAEMDAMLVSLGVSAPAIEEDFLETVNLPVPGGRLIYNIYAPTDWTGDPSPPAGVESGWFAPDELDALLMEEHVRDAILTAFGLKQPVDRTDEILAALSGEAGAPPMPAAPPVASARAPSSNFEKGLDVLRTLNAADPAAGYARLQRGYPELAEGVVEAIGEYWTGPALDRKTRSLQVVAMLAALGRLGPLRSHIGGALNHGATPEQVVETIRMVAVYAGFPAALEAWPVMEDVFKERGVPRPGRPGAGP